MAMNYSLSGVLLRSTGIKLDIRKTTPYEVYSHISFKVPFSTNGDSYDRYLLRVEEMRESCYIIWQCLQSINPGPTKITSKISSPSRHGLKNEMESLIHHFKFFSSGFFLPLGEAYTSVEAPKGEFGVFLISSGSNMPYRCKIRAPGFSHLQAISYFSKNLLIADVVVIIGTLDIVFGEIDR